MAAVIDRFLAPGVPRVRTLVVVVVAAAAVIIYQQTIPVNQAVRSRLGQLVVTQTGLPGYKKVATTANQIPNSSNPFAAVKTAAKERPNNTGGYTREWENTTSKYRITDLIASWVPTSAIAGTAQDQAVTAYLGKSTYTAESYSYGAAFAVPGVAGARGASYQAKATKGVPATTLAVSIFRQGLVVVVVDTLGINPAQTRADNTALARVEASHLTTTEPGFTLVRTTRPLLATVLFAAATVAVAVALAFLVTLIPRARRRRRARRAARARYEVQLRGQKIVKRHRTSSR
jgi:hypothetical protein